MSADHEEREVTISGVKVVFPCKPYPSQFGMMDRVIKGLVRKQNCLLESPTGSGKSLALLCSALAWQNTEHLKAAKDAIASQKVDNLEGECCKACMCKNETPSRNPDEYLQKEMKQEPGKSSGYPIDLGEDDDDDFKVPSKYRTTTAGQSAPKKRGHVSITYDNEEAGPSTGNPNKPCDNCTCNKDSPIPMGKQKVPKIYFGTRTHKQIAQIVRELKKTAYHDVRMGILASREYTCIHPQVVKLRSKSEGCRERLDVNGPGCTFNDKAKRVFLSQGQLQNELPTAWDLEELTHACRGKKACPYFVTRNIKEQADIIFCPYNYLIDPLVRKSMEIHLKDQVVILDEAHNIEDCARDAASGQLTTAQISQALQHLQELMDANVKYSEHLILKRLMENVMRLVDENVGNLEQADYDTAYKVWSGFDMVARLENVGLGPDTVSEYKSCLESLGSNDEEPLQQNNFMKTSRSIEPKLHSSSVKLIELILQILDYMYRSDLKFVEDYRVAVMKSVEYVTKSNMNDSWLGKNRRGKTRQVVFTLNFWCMNPAVAFSDFSECRNVVLSSGTLSPMNSFASELGVAFPVQLEANHVIKDEQVWVGSVGVGPSGSQLQAVYKNMETFTFQDELGNLILQVCQKVPHGVLCFLPSYRALEKFTDRWKLTKVWEKLACHKKILVEPRAADREDFDYMMRMFYAYVKDPSYDDEEDYANGGDTAERDGAIFFAVFRGKVSEGMDFADDNARAVITVGIPFPSIKDLQVKLKREYNDKYRASRGLLSGNEWYEIQAFRALNQALGRCIRHRKDWGAIILVDDRFVRMAGKYIKGLSKWVRNKVRSCEAFPQFLESVSSFTEKMKKEMPVVNPDTSFIPCTPSTPAARRRSVYNEGTPIQTFTSPPLENSASPYFGNSNGSTPRSMPTPNKILPGQSLLSGKVSNMIKQATQPRPVVLATTVPGVTINEQLQSIINSAHVPKDRPYRLVLNKGTPNEQAFDVDPANMSQATNPPETKTPPSADIDSNLQHLQPKEPAVNPDMKTFAIEGVAGMPLQDQLKQILSSPSMPKEEPYFLIFNKGKPGSQTLLIEPSKQKKKSNNKGIIEPTAGTSTTLETVAVKSEPSTSNENTTMTMVQKEEISDPGNAKREVPSAMEQQQQPGGTSNKFLKFCTLPNQNTDVESTDLDQKPSIERTESPVLFEHTVSMDMCSESTNTNGDMDTSVIPTLSTDNTVKQTHSVGLPADSVKDMLNDTSKKKPLFKKAARNIRNVQNVKREGRADTVKCDKLANKDLKPPGDIVKEVVNADTSDNGEELQDDMATSERRPFDNRGNISKEDTAKVDERKEPHKKDNKSKQDVENCERKQSVNNQDDSGSRRKSRGKFDRSIIDKLMPFRRRTLTNNKDESGESENKVEKEVLQDLNVAGNHAESDTQSEEEFLCTRRKSGRKRLSNSIGKVTTKRQKGVHYDEKDTKEYKNDVPASYLCAKCGNVFHHTQDFDREIVCPQFLKRLGGGVDAGVIQGHLSAMDGVSLQCVTLDTHTGPVLDACYIPELHCCVQYLHCGHCLTGNQSVIGATVIMTETQSQYTSGQTWLIQSAVKK